MPNGFPPFVIPYIISQFSNLLFIHCSEVLNESFLGMRYHLVFFPRTRFGVAVIFRPDADIVGGRANP